MEYRTGAAAEAGMLQRRLLLSCGQNGSVRGAVRSFGKEEVLSNWKKDGWYHTANSGMSC